jgi:hypothetical protein
MVVVVVVVCGDVVHGRAAAHVSGLLLESRTAKARGMSTPYV